VSPPTGKKWPILLLFVLFWFAFAYVNGGWGFNQYSRLDLLHAFVVHQTMTIDADHNNTGDKAYFNGHYYSDKAPGIAFLALPAYATSLGLLKATGIPWESNKGWNSAHWLTSIGSVGLLAALGGVTLFLLLRRFIGSRYALITVIATFLGSLPFPYSTMLFSHGAVIGLISIALWAVMEVENPQTGRKRKSQQNRIFMRDILAGLCCGLAVACEYTTGFAFIGIFALVLSKGFRSALSFSCAAALPLLLIPLYSWACFGSVLHIGYDHVQGLDGMQQGFFGITFRPDFGHLFALLFGPARGLFFWTPFFLLSLIGIFSMFKKDPLLAGVIVIVAVLQIIAISGYSYWDGGRALGPRHLAAIVPFLAISSGMGLALLPHTGTVLAALSVALYSLATFVDPTTPFMGNPVSGYYLPSLFQGKMRQNLGLVLGLSQRQSVIFFLLVVCSCIALLFVLNRCEEPQHQSRL